MTDSMRRVVATSAGIEVIEAAIPVVAVGEAQVRMALVGVCGSDTHAAHGRHPFVPLPYRPGHEVIGTVTAVADDVTDIAPGDRVVVEPTLPCGECKMCRTERSNICENLRFFGCGYDQGGMADYFTVPANRLHAVPTDFTDEQAILIEPLATPAHAVRLSGEIRNRAVVIIGAGTIGLLVLAAARFAGARRIVVTDVLESKLTRARRLGADATVSATDPDPVAAIRAALGESADVVFDCVAIQSTLDQSIALAQKGGTVMVVGVPAAAVTVPLPQIQDLQMRIQGSATYLAEDYARSIEIIGAGVVRPEDIITSRYPLSQAAQAFAASSGGEEVKVIVEP